MTLSLLYHSEHADSQRLDKRVLSHLSLDRAFERICVDGRMYESFMRVLTDFTSDREVILYRQAILRDFETNPSLLAELSSLYRRFDELRTSQKQTVRDDFRVRIDGAASMDAARNLLAMNALCCKRALLFIKAFSDLMTAADISSAGLLKFTEACRRIACAAELEKLLRYCAKYENSHSSGFLDFRLMLDDLGRITSYHLIDHRYIQISDPDLQKKRSFFRKAVPTSAPSERLYPIKGDSYDTLAVSAISALSSLFSSISEQIFEEFSGICRELDFYDVARKYMKLLDEKDIPMCYPTFSSDGTAEVSDLYDLYLAVSTSHVVPNDLRLGKRQGLLVFGDNGSGKTVYLRSIGCMQVLAQAGLPVPARAAVLTLHSQIAAQFSEAEKIGAEAGRFEQEVRELAAIVESLSDGALVMLNETFQSTAYDEGATALEEILRYFTDCGVRWMLVSHLHQLESRSDVMDAAVVTTADGYRIQTKRS